MGFNQLGRGIALLLTVASFALLLSMGCAGAKVPKWKLDLANNAMIRLANRADLAGITRLAREPQATAAQPETATATTEAAGPGAGAVFLDKAIFPKVRSVGDHVLTLRGAGIMRYQGWVKVFAAALYLDETTPSDAVLTDVPKRLEIEYFWSVAGSKLGSLGRQSLKENISADQLLGVEEKVARIDAMYQNVRRGDRYCLTYTPGVGTELTLNGNSLGTIEGADFSSAYFSIWLGPKPMDPDLRTRLLASSRDSVAELTQRDTSASVK